MMFKVSTEQGRFTQPKPTPYMQKLRFSPHDASAADPDERVLSDRDLEQAAAEGEQAGNG